MNDATPSSISYDHLTNPVPVLITFQPTDYSINDALPRISLWNQSLPTVQHWSERHARSAHLNQYDTGAWMFFTRLSFSVCQVFKSRICVCNHFLFQPLFRCDYSNQVTWKKIIQSLRFFFWKQKLSSFFANGPITLITLGDDIVAN